MRSLLARRSLTAPVLLLLAAAACSPATDPGLTHGVTPSTHAWFPIGPGTPHAYGLLTRDDGPVGCGSCHPAGADSFTAFTCVGCHAHEETLTRRVHTAVPGYAFRSEACYACHPDTAVLVTGAAPGGLFSEPAQAVVVQALIPRYQGTSIASVSPLQETLPMPMDHASAQLPAGALSDCSNCHSNAGSGSFLPGLLHSSLANLTLPQPQGCASCHLGSAPTGFVGPLALHPPRTPATGEMKHDAVAWTAAGPGTTPLVPSECGLCHAAPSQSRAAGWASGPGGEGGPRYHASLDAAGQAQPGSCLDCHANGRPAGLLTSATVALPPGLGFDHGAGPGLGDCAGCHRSTSTWTQGRFHLAGSGSPASCLPCHQGERPTSTAGWLSTSYQQAPFDYGSGGAGPGHGDGLDCATCHQGPGTGAWGASPNWASGRFVHGAGTASASTCVACHQSQRPDLVLGVAQAKAVLPGGFDHSVDGAGDCFGCHQATVTAGTYARYLNASTGKLPNGDWKGGVAYPGATFASSLDQSFTVTESVLQRSGGLVTGLTQRTPTYYNGMKHTASVLPAALNAGPTGSPNASTCWHCHASTGTTVTAYSNGHYHASLTSYSATPGGTRTPFPQPTRGCAECHATDLPHDIVERSASVLVPMDHAARFTAPASIGGVTAAGVADLDCSTCHAQPGVAWSDGRFHATTGAATPADCLSCHYPLMATPALADLDAGVGAASMRHRSAQLTLQACAACHQGALARAGTASASSWRGGALHAAVPAQPSSCLECHARSEPLPNASTQSSVSYTLVAGATATNGGQWMNHGAGAVAGQDCAACHLADARTSGSAWSKATSFHGAVHGVLTCAECHGFDNGGGAVAGTRNNLPLGLTSSTTVSAAGSDPATGVPAGTLDQLAHTELNVAGRDCGACHLQQGVSAVPGIQGKEWAQASFHTNFTALTPLVMNGTTGRCSACHLNLRPTAAYTRMDHSTFTAAPGSKDCASCHAWPGLGTPASPDWKGAQGMPPYLSVGAFTIPRPPAATAGQVQPGITLLPHPTPGPTATCLTCHATAEGGTGARGYDHPPGLIDSNCGACHEAGSPLVAAPWNGATAEGLGAGDTRPFTLASVTAQHGAGMTVRAANHFFPVDCNECHRSPAGLGLTTTGPDYAATAWAFPHDQARMTNPGTCLLCHVGGVPGAPDGGVSASSVAVDELLPRWSGTTLVSVLPQSVELPMTMQHASPDIPPAASAGCLSCHTGAPAGNYRPGVFHGTLAALKLPQPAGCASCHADALPAGFTGPTATAPARAPASGEMRHDAVAWTAAGAPTSTRLVPGSCALCHAAPTEDLAATWRLGRDGGAPASYHPALAAAGQAQPGSCLDCHANGRPAGVLTSSSAALPAGLSFDHGAALAQGDCQGCHQKSRLPPFASWSGGLFHLAGSASPTTCLPCHGGERPTSAAGWRSTTYAASPFDYGTNALGITHGDGQDCAACHPGPGSGAWGGSQTWVGGRFVHGAGTPSATTCVACHQSQRPDLVLGAAAAAAALGGFDHARDGTGECASCHQHTVTAGTYVNYYSGARTLPGGDWQGGVAYPGETLALSSDHFITLDETSLVRSGTGLVTGTTVLPGVKLSNAMLHTSTALPPELNAGPRSAPVSSTCWHCHTSTGTTVTSFANGQYHASLTGYRATPGGTVAPRPQPTTCLDCHAQMLPAGGIVQRGGSDLLAMDHSARFSGTVTIGGQAVSAVDQLDCATCHARPGVAWSDGAFHARIGAVVPADCVACHYLLMADRPRADADGGVLYRMQHASAQVPFQRCEACHAAALGKAAAGATAALWAPGVFHPAVGTQPTLCLDCHAPSEPLAAAPTQSTVAYAFPAGGTSSNSGQWLNHATSSFASGGAVADCAACHQADARTSGAAWSRSTAFHATHPSLTTCDGCHGLVNRSPSLVVGPATAAVGTPGTGNNLPAGLTSSTVVSAASSNPATGVPAGTHDQLDHGDYNVRTTPCLGCHTQSGPSTVTGVQGKEWTVARFHAAFSAARPLVMNSTGRCSTCHLNVRPGAGFSTDHSGYTATSATDCSSCHTYPGTGTAAAPNWVTSAVPATLVTGGFTVSKPPASTTTTVQAPVPFAVPHPVVGTQACTVCHLTSSGGRPAKGYDHDVSNGVTKLNVAGSCNPCHEAGSPFVTPVWNGATTASAGAGDTRPITLATIVPTFKGNRTAVPAVNHFYPTDCFACHRVPSGNGTGLVYLTAWKFNHNETNMKGACSYCHPPLDK